ncbi:MAG: hypothetical protein RR636_14960 [Clostridium sp.]
MKKIVIIGFIALILMTSIVFNEFRNTCSINKNFSNPVEDSIKLNLEDIYNQEVLITSIDGCVEDTSRIVYFSLVDTNETKIVLYLNSFITNRLKYIDEIQNIEKYKNYF